MFTTENTSRPAATLFRNLALLVLLLAGVPCQLVAQGTAGLIENNATNARPQSAIENMANIQQSLESKRTTVRELREQLKQLEDVSEKQALEQKIERVNKDITSLQLAFENIALGSPDLSVLTDEPEQQIDWRIELEQVSRPLLSTIKELTAKPRQIDSMQREAARQEDQLKVIEKAINSINHFKQESLPPLAEEPINQLLIDWEQRRDDVQRALEITRFKLTNLKTDSAAWYTSAGEAFTEFLSGRGLTLLLAILVSVAIWLLSKWLLAAYWRWLFRAEHDIGITRAPLIYYSYRLGTAIIIVFAILLVFYVRGDVLFLTLALIALAGAALTLRQTLPRYAAELRLLLGVGPVREKERLVLDEVPFIVESLGVFTVLKNPALEGVVRLPLHDMNALVSRPASQEPWFPCQPGDFILLADGSFGAVLRQTIELVEVMVRDSKVQIRTKDFLGQNVRNLSREGFGVASAFGVDYQHQAICLDTVPARFREAISARFELAGMKDDIVDMLVEFKEAGPSSLDYQIYMILNGRAAKAYFRVQRMIQQACVDACNREGWVIPFTQVTVHSGNSAEGPGKQPEETASGITQIAAAPAQHPG
jgi:small-conductance mechanosensitive channel